MILRLIGLDAAALENSNFTRLENLISENSVCVCFLELCECNLCFNYREGDCARRGANNDKSGSSVAICLGERLAVQFFKCSREIALRVQNARRKRKLDPGYAKFFCLFNVKAESIAINIV